MLSPIHKTLLSYLNWFRVKTDLKLSADDLIEMNIWSSPTERLCRKTATELQLKELKSEYLCKQKSDILKQTNKHIN